MSKEIPLKLVVETLSNEKGVSEEIIFQAIEAALVSATKKKEGVDSDVRVSINRKTGQYDTFRVWTVVDEPNTEQPEIEFPLREMPWNLDVSQRKPLNKLF